MVEELDGVRSPNIEDILSNFNQVTDSGGLGISIMHNNSNTVVNGSHSCSVIRRRIAKYLAKDFDISQRDEEWITYQKSDRTIKVNKSSRINEFYNYELPLQRCCSVS